MSGFTQVSVIIVSFNTRNLLRDCLRTLDQESTGIGKEVFVVDNRSNDGSADMVGREFPNVKLLVSRINLGFAAANNLAFPYCTGSYVVLLNSDAFLYPGALQRAITYMDADETIGLGGARLVGRDQSQQPSARMFPSLLNDFLTLSGLSSKFPRSRFFGRFDRTWADPTKAASVDWVPGAFSIIRRSVLEKIGYFDENFFLYYEEVDLCRRIHSAGYQVRYWPDVVVVHLGGESSRTVGHVALSNSGSQLTLWRMRSALLYYHKHHGQTRAWLARMLERLWHNLRERRHRSSAGQERSAKTQESRQLIALLDQAWHDTSGGRISPPRPW